MTYGFEQSAYQEKIQDQSNCLEYEEVKVKGRYRAIVTESGQCIIKDFEAKEESKADAHKRCLKEWHEAWERVYGR